MATYYYGKIRGRLAISWKMPCLYGNFATLIQCVDPIRYIFPYCIDKFAIESLAEF